MLKALPLALYCGGTPYCAGVGQDFEVVWKKRFLVSTVQTCTGSLLRFVASTTILPDIMSRFKPSSSRAMVGTEEAVPLP